MVTDRCPDPRGIETDTPFYGFYVKASGTRRAMLMRVRDKLTERYGTPPSNPKLLDEILAAFPLHGVPANG